MNIPQTNAVYYELENGSFICVRPSGTEPKLKIYYSVRAKDEDGLPPPIWAHSSAG